MNFIDLNADIGEGFPFDEALMPLLSSCNIACSGHIGNDHTMRQTILLAKKHHLNIGAHPSYPDKKDFGRKEIEIKPEELLNSLILQVTSLLNIAEEEKTHISYIKPHGALYNKAMVDYDTTNVIIQLIQHFPKPIALMGMPNSYLEKECKKNDIPFIRESFADRRYTSHGTLVPRTDENAVIHNNYDVWAQVQQIISKQIVTSIDNQHIHLPTDSICFHGDTPEAFELLAYVSQKLKDNNISVQAYDKY